MDISTTFLLCWQCKKKVLSFFFIWEWYSIIYCQHKVSAGNHMDITKSKRSWVYFLLTRPLWCLAVYQHHLYKFFFTPKWNKLDSWLWFSAQWWIFLRSIVFLSFQIVHYMQAWTQFHQFSAKQGLQHCSSNLKSKTSPVDLP